MGHISEFEKKFCCGCGLCNNFNKGKLDEKGYYRPEITLNYENFDSSVCYCNYLARAVGNELWGKIEQAYYGYSTNNDIRKQASSGGILTAIACYLLNSKEVDCVIQMEASKENQLVTEVRWNTNVNQVMNCCGSRYTASASLINILNNIDFSKKYAIIGKPCDIRVLREYIKLHEEYKNIIYLLTFFCGGTPSKQANQKLMECMNINPKKLKSFTYRGNGWPGKTTGITSDGHVSTIEYEESWGKVLGRDLQSVCRFCWEGVGEAADISCGDGWYLENNKPSFKEQDGRNIILVRNEKGSKLLNNMLKNGDIQLEELESLETLKHMQPGQYMRKSSMFASVSAMKLMGKQVPKYKLSSLWPYAKVISLKDNFRIFSGTIKRIIKGKIK